MAAAFFNSLADAKVARAVSAGGEPATRVQPEVLDAMRELGLDLADKSPQALTPALLDGIRMLILLADQVRAVETPPSIRRIAWRIDDPAGRAIADVRSIRDTIRAEVRRLIADSGWGPGVWL
jgi:arsenate reductase